MRLHAKPEIRETMLIARALNRTLSRKFPLLIARTEPKRAPPSCVWTRPEPLWLNLEKKKNRFDGPLITDTASKSLLARCRVRRKPAAYSVTHVFAILCLTMCGFLYVCFLSFIFTFLQHTCYESHACLGSYNLDSFILGFRTTYFDKHKVKTIVCVYMTSLNRNDVFTLLYWHQ